MTYSWVRELANAKRVRVLKGASKEELLQDVPESQRLLLLDCRAPEAQQVVRHILMPNSAPATSARPPVCILTHALTLWLLLVVSAPMLCVLGRH